MYITIFFAFSFTILLILLASFSLSKQKTTTLPIFFFFNLWLYHIALDGPRGAGQMCFDEKFTDNGIKNKCCKAQYLVYINLLMLRFLECLVKNCIHDIGEKGSTNYFFFFHGKNGDKVNHVQSILLLVYVLV